MIKKLLLPMFVGSLLMFAACGESDPCADVICGTGGQCLEGECICDAGYEKDADNQCNALVLDRIAGAYTVVEDCSNSAADTYVASIAKVDATNFKITKFWNLFQNQVNATIEDDGSFKIARQEPDNDKFFVEGTGTLGTNAAGKATITWNYTVKDETGATVVTDNCTSTVFTQQ
jgi:hypothetical protein